MPIATSVRTHKRTRQNRLCPLNREAYSESQTGYVFECGLRWYARFDYTDELGKRRTVRPLAESKVKSAAKELLDVALKHDLANQPHSVFPEEQNSTMEETQPSDPRKIFVVCGRNENANKAMLTFLRSIGLDPREWTQWVQATQQGSPYTGEVLKKGFQEAKAFVILMTPDDEARLREPLRSGDEEPYEINLTPQPRPNVIYEAGMAMMSAEQRPILVELGKLRPISDIFGRHVVRIRDTAASRKELAQRLSTAGCPVDLTGNHWLDAGDFDAALEGL